jgi:RHS repeat-associated protein
MGSVPTVEYAYDASGRVRSVVRHGETSSVATDAEYDGAGQLTLLVHFTDEADLEVYEITRDTRGNPTEVTTTTDGVSTSALYTYDVVSRLKSECYPATGAVCTARSPKTSYTYDKVGNRTAQSVRTVTGNTPTTVSTAYTYDAADQLLTESVGSVARRTNTWSANGALATSTTPSGTKVYTTDLTDELISLTLEDDSTVGYTQDALGNRTSRTVDGVVDATWAWDDLSSLPTRIGEYDASGTLTTAWIADPTSSTGASLAQTTGGVSSWLLSDPFANTVATVSTTGDTVSGTRTMDAFGVERTPATGALADAATGFAGQYLDAATGLYDMRARDYDPTSGRFTATDPVQVPTGMPYVAGYPYAFNNPLMLSDVSGAWPDGDGLYNAAADVVNGAASFVNAMNQNPLATVALVVGLWFMIDGAAKDGVAAVATVATGGGAAVAAVPVAGVGTLEVAVGGALVLVGGYVLVQEAMGDCSIQIMEHRSSGGEGSSSTAAGSGGRMIGENGTQTVSKPMGQGKGWRIDVENPAPGVRPGQMHLQDYARGKWQYDFKLKKFVGAPKKLLKEVDGDPAFARAIKNGLQYLGEGG